MKNPSVYRQIAELHCSAIDQGFLAELGPAFLTLLYKALDQSQWPISGFASLHLQPALASEAFVH